MQTGSIKPVMLVRLGISEWQKSSCALGLTGLQCTKLSYPIAVSQCNSLCTWVANTILSTTDMEEPFQLPWTSSRWNTVLLNWTSDPAAQPKVCCLYWLLYPAAPLTPWKYHIYPGSGWKMQLLVSWSEPCCSAAGKGYQTVGILARLTRLCTLRLPVMTQLCLLSFHVPKQRGQ